MTTRWGARFAMVGALAGCEPAAQVEATDATDTCTTCGTDDTDTPAGGDSAAPTHSGGTLTTPDGDYRYDPDCFIGGRAIPTVYYVQTYTLDGTAVTGTDQMVWVEHPSKGVPVCTISWPVTGTSSPCEEDCDLHLAVHTGDPTTDQCSADRASWGDLFANGDSEWFVWSGTGDEVRVAFSLLDDGYPGTLTDGVLAFVHTQCNGT